METKSGSYSFIIILSLYLLLHTFQMRGIGPEWIRFYGKDLIIVPLILLGTTRLQAILNRKIEIQKKEIILLVIYISLVFEVIMPLIKPGKTTDIWDILMYIAGAQIYYLLFRSKTEKFSIKKTLV